MKQVTKKDLLTLQGLLYAKKATLTRKIDQKQKTQINHSLAKVNQLLSDLDR